MDWVDSDNIIESTQIISSDIINFYNQHFDQRNIADSHKYILLNEVPSNFEIDSSAGSH